jgi:hypothetical protein
MIPVVKQPAPANFTEKVTEKANAFLNENPCPGVREIYSRPYWRKVLDQLHQSYKKVCAYSALWCPLDMATVDHFIPVSVLIHIDPGLAYDWDNFRLASRSMNCEKHTFRDVVDPFLIEYGWFVMDFPSLVVKSSAGLAPDNREKVEATIRRLKLNEKEKYIEYRREFLGDYCKLCAESGSIKPALEHLEKKAPFIAYELKRQELTQRIIHMMKYPHHTGTKKKHV